MPDTITTPWDSAEHLASEEDRPAYLEAALEEGDPALFALRMVIDERLAEHERYPGDLATRDEIFAEARRG